MNEKQTTKYGKFNTHGMEREQNLKYKTKSANSFNIENLRAKERDEET